MLEIVTYATQSVPVRTVVVDTESALSLSLSSALQYSAVIRYEHTASCMLALQIQISLLTNAISTCLHAFRKRKSPFVKLHNNQKKKGRATQ